MATNRTSPQPASPGYSSARNGSGMTSVRLEVLEEELAVDQDEREHDQSEEDRECADQIPREGAAAFHCCRLIGNVFIGNVFMGKVFMGACCRSPTDG